MRIKIDNFLIESDDLNYTLSERKVRGSKSKHEGSEHYKILGYYGSLEDLFKWLLRLKIGRSTSTTLKQLKKDIEWARIEICSLWEGV